MAMKLPARHLQPGLERAGLVAGPIRPVEVLDVDALGGVPANRQLGDFAGLVGRVVQHLDFEQLPRVIEAADGIDEPVGHVHLVVDRELNRHNRQRVERRRFDRLGILMPHVKIHEVIAMPAVNSQNAQDKEVADEDDGVRGSHSVSKAGGKTSADYTPNHELWPTCSNYWTRSRTGQVGSDAAAEQVLQLVNTEWARSFAGSRFCAGRPSPRACARVFLKWSSG